MKTITTIISFLLFIHISFAQTPSCEVLTDSLKGTYEGDCKKGKADGIGKATGADSYEGGFKNGFPEGTGTYKWKNGDWFTGNWKKGLMDGKGEYFTKTKNSSLVGFWKKNVYKGMYEKPYDVINQSDKVSHLDVNSLDKKGNIVIVSMVSGMLAQANVDDFQVVSGTYDRYNKREMIKTKVIEFQNVQFPFRVKFNIGGSPFEIQIFESGQWQVDLML
ncbi:MAG: hypothetical protein ABJA78_03805 [Ferruginibacter sp.]